MSAKQQEIAEAPKQAGQGEAPEAELGVGALEVEQNRESLAGNDLLEEILSRENLLQALQRVKSNRGAPGVDGMTVGELPQYLKDAGRNET